MEQQQALQDNGMEQQQQEQQHNTLDPTVGDRSQATQAAGQQPDPAPVQQLGSCTLLQSSSGKRIWECSDFCGRPCIIKGARQSASKHPFLDRKLAKNPSKQDVAGLCRVRKLGVPTPVPLHVNPDHGLVFMSKVDCSTLKQRLNAAAEVDAVLDQLLSDLGKLLALMHDGGVVHGALSSSCVLVRHSDQALLLQDFECFINSKSPKDKAADLVVLEADLQEQHPTLPGLFDKVVASYNKHNKQWSAVFNRLPEVRKQLQKHSQGQARKKTRRQ